MVKSKQTREVCPSRTPTGHCEETWCRAAAGHSLARIGSPLVPALVLDRLWCRGRRPLGTATCVASLPICPTLPGRRHRVVTCFIICATHPPPPTHCLPCSYSLGKGRPKKDKGILMVVALKAFMKTSTNERLEKNARKPANGSFMSMNARKVLKSTNRQCQTQEFRNGKNRPITFNNQNMCTGATLAGCCSSGPRIRCV